MIGVKFMNIKNNKRTIQSKKKVCDTLLEMLSKVGHKDLTVKNLCKEANINRTTFYIHYDNIEDVLYQIFEDYVIRVYNVFTNNEIEYKQRVGKALNILLEQEEFFKYIVNNVNSLDLRVLEIVEKNIKIPHLNTEVRLSLIYRISGIIGIIKIFFMSSQKTDNKLSINDIAELIYKLKEPKTIL